MPVLDSLSADYEAEARKKKAQEPGPFSGGGALTYGGAPPSDADPSTTTTPVTVTPGTTGTGPAPDPTPYGNDVINSDYPPGTAPPVVPQGPSTVPVTLGGPAPSGFKARPFNGFDPSAYTDTSKWTEADQANFESNLQAGKDPYAAATSKYNAPATPPPSPGPFGGGGQFTDPALNFASNYAMTRFDQRVNPDPNSGTAMYEKFAKEFAAQLQAPVFSSSEEAALRAKAFDQLERSKQQELRQMQERLAGRNMRPDSGLYRSEMNRVRDKWDALKAQNENELLTSGIAEHQRRLTQSFTVLASLMGSENSRLDAAMALAMIPVQLQQQSFGNAVTAAGLGGNPSAMTQQLLSLLTIATGNNQYNDSQKQAAFGSIGEWLGSLFS